MSTLGLEGYERWHPPTITVNFWFRSRPITAVGSISDAEHPNVLRLHIQPSLLERIITTTLNNFPLSVQSSFIKWPPELFLPTTIVLKSQKPGWEEEFDTELESYQNLRSLQGTVIPYHYGTVRFNGVRAHILSDVGGICLPEKGASGLEETALRNMLHRAFSALASHNYLHDDMKLDNFHLVGGKIMTWNA